MKKIVLGILAHVDAGKTTLSEALLYRAGALRNLGRVDNGTASLDTHDIEKSRGITVFSGQSSFTFENTQITLIDTPGHVDFSAETERILQVLDYGVLVISATDGVQAHTRTLWRLLEQYNVPTFIFVTKTDFNRRSPESLASELNSVFGNCVNFSKNDCFSANAEDVAQCSENLLDEYLSTGVFSKEALSEAILQRKLFPCYFGSGLRGEGIEEFLHGIDTYTRGKPSTSALCAKVYKISHDKNDRLTYVKITGGKLSVRDSVFYRGNTEKVSGIRIYNGSKFETVQTAEAGDAVVLCGLRETVCGDSLFSPHGVLKESEKFTPLLEPVMRYRLILPEGVDAKSFFLRLRPLGEEEPMLNFRWEEGLSEIYVHLMGEVQGEILVSLIQSRLGVSVTLDEGRAVYKETVDNTVEGVGHYEPLRHYAEVHLIIEPGERGSGITYACDLSVNDLDLNWQRLILTNLSEKEHKGVLTGSPLTDVKITIAAGKAHLKHTEGGDFRQAVYRAVRQGLMQAKSRLLEPYYAFTLTLPQKYLSRGVNDIRLMHGTYDTPDGDGSTVTLKGLAPVVCMAGYAKTVASYTAGEGSLLLENGGYGDCHNAEKVIEEASYDPCSDMENPPDSVFCAHGGGFNVKWDKVFEYMHLPPCLNVKKSEEKKIRRNISIEDKELEAIMLREFGPIKRPVYKESVTVEARAFTPDGKVTEQCLIVDGYNVIFAWDELSPVSDKDLSGSREALMNILANYAAFTGCRVVLVFDAYRVAGGNGEKFDYHGISVVYTKENETGDVYIERLIYEIGKSMKVRVVTSDRMIQLSAIHTGVLRMSSAEFRHEIEAVDREIGELARELSEK